MRPPKFWRHGGSRLLPALLRPLAAVSGRLTAIRVARPGWRAPVPVICCGNVTVGGAGKTIVALDLARRLQARNLEVHFLTRGHGGRVRGVHRVAADDLAALVGDEPRLLAAVAPTWVSRDRAAGARAAVAAGAQVLLMDDGLQNPGLAKDLSLLVVDGRTGFGNGRTLPAGPLRESVGAGAARCQAAILIGADATGVRTGLGALPVLRAWLTPGPATRALAGRRVVAFAGIASPGKFFATLLEAGATLVARHGFPDHHAFSEAELAAVLTEAIRLDATPVTTAKDAARLSALVRAQVVVADVVLTWQDPAVIAFLLDRLRAAPFAKATLPGL